MAHEEVNFFNTNYNFVKDIKNFDFSRKIKTHELIDYLRSKDYVKYLKTIKKKENIIKKIFYSRRTLFKKGLIVSLIGPDGTGKTTLTNDLKKIFTKKILVKKFYLGKIKFFKKNLLFSSVINIINKFYKLYSIRKLKNKGFLILTDRYPTNNSKFNDGPLLFETKTIFSKIEKKIYNFFFLSFPPDIVFKLYANPKEIVKRKVNLKIYLIQKKLNYMQKLKFSKKTKIIPIKVNRNLNYIKKKILYEILNYEKN